MFLYETPCRFAETGKQGLVQRCLRRWCFLFRGHGSKLGSGFETSTTTLNRLQELQEGGCMCSKTARMRMRRRVGKRSWLCFHALFVFVSIWLVGAHPPETDYPIVPNSTGLPGLLYPSSSNSKDYRSRELRMSLFPVCCKATCCQRSGRLLE